MPYRLFCVVIGLATLVAASAVYQALLPPAIPAGVVEKLEFFATRQDEFNTLLLGSSRFYHALSPEIFDGVTRENGVSTRTFNFGIDGMGAPENFYLLDQILKTNPRGLKWILIEVDNIQTKTHLNILGTQRLLYWHDWERTTLALKKVIDPRPGLKWHQKLSRLWRARRELILHLSLFQKHFASVGRVASFFSPAVAASESDLALGPKGDGHRPSGAPMPEERAEKFRRDLAYELTSISSGFMDPYAEKAYRDCARKIRQVGATPVFVVTPSLSQSPLRFQATPEPPGPFLVFNDSKTYPQLYEAKVRVDEQHLTDEGSAEFTRLLALEFARSVQRP